MGKRAQAKKLAKALTQNEDRQLVNERRKARLSPAIAATRKLVITVLATVVLLSMGVFVTHRLGLILSKLMEKGS